MYTFRLARPLIEHGSGSAWVGVGVCGRSSLRRMGSPIHRRLFIVRLQLADNAQPAGCPEEKWGTSVGVCTWLADLEVERNV
jgi:hypothetical protein